MHKNLFKLFGLAAVSFLCLIEPALADKPIEWGLGLQNAASPSMERITEFHNMLLYIITGITLFVLALLVIVVLRFNKRANPVPSQTTHNVILEVIWTVVPVVILIIIAIPSFKLLYYTNRVDNPDMTLKVTGYQWYWGYEYPDNGGVNFQSYMVPDADINEAAGQVRLLSTDNPVVVPVGKNIQVDITAGDVLHSWAVPALGVKTDSVPGRLNSTWFRINEPGVYFGQCSELCGKDHAYMPIEIHAVTEAEFNSWIVEKGGTALGAQAELEEPLTQLDTGVEAPVSESVAPETETEIKDDTEETVQEAPATEGEE